MIGCSYYFKVVEDWTFLEGLYYYCITLLTIGFGDYVPLKNTELINTPFKYFGHFIFTVIFLLSGKFYSYI